MADDQNGNGASASKKKSSKGGLLKVIILLLVIVGVLYFLNNGDKESTNSVGEESQTEGELGQESEQAQLDAAYELIGSGEVDGDFSYAAGVITGQQLLTSIASSQDAATFDPSEFARAITQILTNKKTSVDVQTATELVQARAAEQQEALTVKAEENKVASDAFVATYAEGEDVQQTELGSYYKVLTEGEGEVVGEQLASVLYKGSLIDGTEFDSTSANGGEPVDFAAQGLIPGIADALKVMKKGSKWEIVVPVELGYGLSAPPIIGGNQALVFEIEVLEINALPELPATPEIEQVQ